MMRVQARLAWSPPLAELTPEGWGSPLWPLKGEQWPKQRSTLEAFSGATSLCAAAESSSLEGAGTPEVEMKMTRMALGSSGEGTHR